MNQTAVQRSYKDSLFRMIFREKKELLSLYNALNGTAYTNPDALTITTIEDVLYMGLKNDISFLIEDVMNLYEGQGIWNPNMPLRGLFYISQVDKSRNARSFFFPPHLSIRKNAPALNVLPWF